CDDAAAAGHRSGEPPDRRAGRPPAVSERSDPGEGAVTDRVIPMQSTCVRQDARVQDPEEFSWGVLALCMPGAHSIPVASLTTACHSHMTKRQTDPDSLTTMNGRRRLFSSRRRLATNLRLPRRDCAAMQFGG